MTTIKQNSIRFLNISFKGHSIGEDLIDQSYVRLQSVITAKSPDTLFLYVEFYSEYGDGTTDFEMKASVVIPFELTTLKEIRKEDLFRCIELTKEHLQKIIDGIFFGQPTPNVPPVLFDKVSGKLDEILENLNQ